MRIPASRATLALLLTLLVSVIFYNVKLQQANGYGLNSKLDKHEYIDSIIINHFGKKRPFSVAVLFLDKHGWVREWRWLTDINKELVKFEFNVDGWTLEWREDKKYHRRVRTKLVRTIYSEDDLELIQRDVLPVHERKSFVEHYHLLGADDLWKP